MTDITDALVSGTTSQPHHQTSLLPFACVVCLFGVITLAAAPSLQRVDSVNAAVVASLLIAVFAVVLLGCFGFTRLSVWLMLFFLVRLAIATTFHQAHWPDGELLYQQGLTGYDAYRYDDSAYRVMLYGWDATNLNVDQWGIVAAFTMVYAAFGHNPLFAVFLNTLFGALTSVAVFYLLRPFASRAVSRAAAIVVMVLPDSILYGAQLMKETLVMLLFAVALLGWTKFQREGKRWGGVVFLLALYALLETRAVYVLVVVVIAAALIVRERRVLFRRPLALAAFVIVLVLVATAGISNYAQGVNVLSPSLWLGRYADLRDYAVNAISSESADPQSSIGLRTAVDFTNPVTYAFIPFRAGTFFLVPPFWVWGALPGFAPFVEISALLSWISLPAALWGLTRLFRQKQGHYLWIPFLLSTLIMSNATPFVDIRYKVALMPLFAALSVLGFEEWRRWRGMYVAYVFLVLCSITGYYGLKVMLRG